MTIDTENAITYVAYVQNGNIVKLTQADGYTTEYTDACLDLAASVNYNGGKQVYRYNKTGVLIYMTDRLGETSFEENLLRDRLGENMKLRHVILATITICLVTLLCSCSGGTDEMIRNRLDQLNEDSAKDLPGDRAEAMLTAIDNDDRGAIKEMFSKTAQDHGVSDESIQSLIDLLRGKIDSWEKGLAGENVGNQYGVKKESFDYRCYLFVDGVQYNLCISECTRDDTNEDNIGVTQITVYPDASYDSFPEGTEDMGLYVFE